MSEVEEQKSPVEVEEKESPLRVEQAPSNRSTCKATGDKIEKGEWRVGMRSFKSGFQTLQWQKAIPFLEACTVEPCTKANSGSCKITSHKFEKGEIRFACTNGKQKIFFTLPAAAKVLQPILTAVEGDFVPVQFKGLVELTEQERAKFFQDFKISAQKAKAFHKEHPPQADRAQAANGPKAKKRKSDADADAEAEQVQPSRKKGAAEGATKKAKTADPSATKAKPKPPSTPQQAEKTSPKE